MANLHDPHFGEPRDHEGFRALRARIGWEIGAERLGLSLWEVQGAAERSPQGGGLLAFFRRDDAVDYYDGEQPPTR